MQEELEYERKNKAHFVCRSIESIERKVTLCQLGKGYGVLGYEFAIERNLNRDVHVSSVPCIC